MTVEKQTYSYTKQIATNMHTHTKQTKKRILTDENERQGKLSIISQMVFHMRFFWNKWKKFWTFFYHIGKPGTGGIRLVRRPRPILLTKTKLSELWLLIVDERLTVFLIPRPVIIYWSSSSLLLLYNEDIGQRQSISIADGIRDFAGFDG